MGISVGASTVYMPERQRPYPALLEFLTERFPKISELTWRERITSGKVFAEDGEPVSLATPYRPNQRLFYFREVTDEPVIPLREEILYCDEHLIVACKPHFLPVTPSGPYVSETLINRLKTRTGNLELSPINRIDRETAGLVLISANQETRGLYQHMFMVGAVAKTYHAVVAFPEQMKGQEWLVENRIEQGKPWFRMQIGEGKVNARSQISLLSVHGTRALLKLVPLTGKKHQLRIHLSSLGMPIVNDRCYPTLLAKRTDDYEHPLQLLAQKIAFRDHVSGNQMSFESKRELSLGSL